MELNNFVDPINCWESTQTSIKNLLVVGNYKPNWELNIFGCLKLNPLKALTIITQISLN